MRAPGSAVERDYPNGAIKQFTYGNGIVHTLTQNARQLPLRSRDADGSTSVHDDTYVYDPVGNVASIADGVAGNRGNRSMTYDALDRLTDTTSPMYGTTGVHYAYDVLDNITHTTAPGRDQALCYDAANRLTKVAQTTCSGAPILTTTFDVQGNLATWNAVAYGFDYGNRLRGVTGLESYRYDALGRRVLAWSPTLGNILSMYSQSGALAFQQNVRNGARNLDYVYLGGSLVATREQDVGTGAVTVTYQHTDALGSPVATTNSAKTVLQRSEYEPYGKLLNRPMEDGPGYTGHVTDAATSLVNMQQRYYDPRVARFWSVDPVTAMSNPLDAFNRYWYALNNPYRFTDPDGRQVAIPWQAIGEVAVKRGVQAGIASQMDSPLLGPGDVVGAIILVGAVGEIGYKIYQANTSDTPTNDDNLDGLIDSGSKEGESSTTKISRPGGEEARDREYGGLGLNGVEDKGNGVQVGTTDSGRRVISRPSTEDGRPTIEVQRPDGKSSVKIRYDNKEVQ